jgi:exosortase/archaeosortase family protein
MQLRAGINQAVSLLHERSPRGQTLRFILFLVLYFLARYLQLFLNTSSFGQAMLNPLHERLSFFITHSCCFLLQGFYPDIHVTINHTIIIAGKATVQMFPGCTGLEPMIRLTFILIFYPLHWRRKIILLPFSLLILLFASTLHFLLLVPIAYQCPEWFGFAHNWLTRVIFYAFYFLCWLLWEKAIPLRRIK